MIQYIFLSILTGLGIAQYLFKNTVNIHNKRIREMLKHNLELANSSDDKNELKDYVKTLTELNNLIV